MQARSSNRTVDISLSGSTLPAGVDAIELTIEIAGQRIEKTFAPAPNLVDTFVWDGKDVYGRTVYGSARATIYIGYVYEGVEYRQALVFGQLTSDVSLRAARSPWAVVDRHNVTLWNWDARAFGFGGWSLDAQHLLDPATGGQLFGDGSRRTNDGRAGTIQTVAGRFPSSQTTCAAEGLVPTAKNVMPRGTAVAPDGTLYFTDEACATVWRVRIGGTLERVAGNGVEDASGSGDGGPAIAAGLYKPWYVALGPDGSVYIGEAYKYRVRRVWPDGTITRFAGTGIHGSSGDGGLAINATLTWAGELAVAADGTVYISGQGGIRRVTPDGVINTFAGASPAATAPMAEGIVATQAHVPAGSIAALTDGSVLLHSEYGQLWQITTEGILRRFAQLPCNGTCGMGNVAVGRDGTVYAAQMSSNAAGLEYSLYRVGPGGALTTIAQGPSGPSQFDSLGRDNRFGGDGGPAVGAMYGHPTGLSVAPDGSIYVADTWNSRIRRIEPLLTRLMGNEQYVASKSGGTVHVYNASGRHARTVDPFTGVALLTFSYDTSGSLASVTDASGNVTNIQRSGNLITITAPGGQQTQLTIGSDGMASMIASPGGITHGFTYTNGLLSTYTDPNTRNYSFTYDDRGRLRRDDDPAGGAKIITSTETDTSTTATITTGLGRTISFMRTRLDGGDERRTTTGADGTQSILLKKRDGTRVTTSPDGVITELKYMADPQLGMQAPFISSETVRMPSGLQMTASAYRYSYVPSGTSPFGLATARGGVIINGKNATFSYDGSAKTLTSFSPRGRAVVTSFDALGRTKRVQYPGLAPLTVGYEPLTGNLSSLGFGSRNTSFTYDTRNRVETVTDALSRTTTFAYNDADQLLSQTLPGNRVVTFAYDDNGNLTSITPPGRDAHTMSYTAVDNLEGYDPPGEPGSLTYQYNIDGQLTKVMRPGGPAIDLVYEPGTGRLQSTTDGTITLGIAYDTAGRVQTLSGGGASVTYGYDGALLTSTTWTGGIAASVGFGYDANFRQTSETVNGASITFAYDDDGSLTNAGGMTITPDAASGMPIATSIGRVTDSAIYENTAERKEYAVVVNGTEMYRSIATRDTAGRVITEAVTLNGITNTTIYGYDAASRLNTVTRNGVLDATYEYDANGNRESVTKNAQVTAATFDVQDRLQTYGTASYAYTPAGELLTRTDASGTTTYSYDAFGNLRTVALPDGRTIDYVVDGQSRRVGKKVNGVLQQGWVYTGQLRIAAELDGAGQVVSRFIYGTRSNVPDLMTKGGVTYRIISDQRGSPVLVIDTSSGEVVQYRMYDEFGNIVSDTNPNLHPFGFAGGLRDADTSLIRFGARDYDPQTARFTTKDPVGFAGGDTNLYGYVLNDPVNLIDPLGTDWVEAMEPVANFFAGMGDTLSFGLTTRFNDWTGASASVDQCSQAYRNGEWTGTGVSVAFGASHLGRNALKQGVRHLAYDNRTWGAVRSAWSGSPGTLQSTGRHLHHWLIPQRAMAHGAPRGIVNAGFNYMPISAGLNSYMNGSTSTRVAVEWGFKGSVAGTYGAAFRGGSGSNGCGCE